MKPILQEVERVIETASIALIVLLLPWSWAFRLLRFCTRFSFMRSPCADAASAEAKKMGLGAQFLQVRLISLHRLVDMADYFLTLKYGRGWMRRNVWVSGDELPASTALAAPLFITFHYGQGFWALRYFRDRGYPVAWLHAPPPLRAPWGEKFNSWMGRRRIAQVARLCGAPAIAVGGSIERMRERLLKAQRAVMAMPDAPLQPGQSSIDVRLLGQPARLPAGAIRMAVQAGVPVVIYSIVVDPITGRRNLRLEGPIQAVTAEALAQRLADHLGSAIVADPSAWHVWPWAGSFFATEHGEAGR
ncbi:MAG: hypothetical protein ABWY06_17080 [Pseudomonas sp.]|uniref:LpxL/LpxP family acyltransferase n=1 Tax=Pseudomonas sp. TaxID=306 RepID=UPI0033937760